MSPRRSLPRASTASAILALVGTAAVTVHCASTSQRSDAPGTTISTRVLSSPGHQLVETTDVDGPDVVQVRGTRTDALTALAQIYNDLQIPIGTMIPDAGQIGNQRLQLATHRLHGHLLSYYLNCGQESMVGNRADLDDVTLSILSTVLPSKDSVTAVATSVRGSARPTGTSSNAVDCQSTGELEKSIAARLNKALGSPAPAETKD